MNGPAVVVALLVAAQAPAPAPSPPTAPSPAPSAATTTSGATTTLTARFPAPAGFTRLVVAPGSYAAYLRALPLLDDGAPLLAFDGRTMATQHLAVVDLDVGSKDLQQCADSAMRLYAEWLFQSGRARTASFHATSGDPLPFRRWAAGERFTARGNKVVWQRTALPVTDAAAERAAYRAWLDAVFMYAGSLSLAKDTVAAKKIAPGDMFVIGGSPGHVLVVLDVVVDDAGAQRLLIGEGYMPAQGFHVVPTKDGGAWHAVVDDALSVPTWPKPFPMSGARRFRP